MQSKDISVLTAKTLRQVQPKTSSPGARHGRPSHQRGGDEIISEEKIASSLPAETVTHDVLGHPLIAQLRQNANFPGAEAKKSVGWRRGVLCRELLVVPTPTYTKCAV